MQKISKQKSAAVYARAWLDAAKERKMEEEVFEEVLMLKKAYADNPEVWNLLAAPSDNKNMRRNIIISATEKLGLSSISAETLALVAESGKIKLLGLILNTFADFYYQDKGIIRVAVETAVSLSEEQNKKLKKTLEQKLNSPVTLEYLINPEILGGLKIHFKSFLIDDSLDGKISRLTALIREN